MNHYETDFYTWTQLQAALLKAGHFSELDLDNLVEEIESMGRSEKRELENRLTVLLEHLLKWQYQPVRHGRSLELSIKIQCIEFLRVLRDNPGLKPGLESLLTDAYLSAVIKASQETGLDDSINSFRKRFLKELYSKSSSSVICQTSETVASIRCRGLFCRGWRFVPGNRKYPA